MAGQGICQQMNLSKNPPLHLKMLIFLLRKSHFSLVLLKINEVDLTLWLNEPLSYKM